MLLNGSSSCRLDLFAPSPPMVGRERLEREVAISFLEYSRVVDIELLSEISRAGGLNKWTH